MKEIKLTIHSSGQTCLVSSSMGIRLLPSSQIEPDVALEPLYAI